MVKRKINEAYDISADLYQWFNKYCCDILDTDGNNIDDLRFDLEEANMNVLVDEASDSLVADFGWDSDSIYEYRDQIEYDLEQLISDALEYIETGYDRGMLSFDKNKTDWMDRYRDNDEYSASLESHNRENKDRKKLETRIARLEKLLTSYRHMKNEAENDDEFSFDEDPWTPDPKYVEIIDRTLPEALKAARKISQECQRSCPEDDTVRTWVRIVNLIENAYNYYDDPDPYNEMGKQLKKF